VFWLVQDKIKLLIFILLISCNKEVDDLGFRVYTIPAGEHRSGSYFSHPENSRINFHFILDESSEYTSEIEENQMDINKIYGFSDFGKLHKKYSIRLGWRYLNGATELCWVKREDGRLITGVIKEIDTNTSYEAMIDIQTFYYIITIDGDTTSVRRRPDGFWGTVRRYYLYPYFGGNEFAPHDITIKIKE
jgi:hypothetical protein